MLAITEQDKEFIAALTLERAKDPGTLDLLRSRAQFFLLEDPLSARIFATLLEEKLNSPAFFNLRTEADIFQKYQDMLVEIRARVIRVLSLEEQKKLIGANFLAAYRYNPQIYDDIIDSFAYYDPDFAQEEAEKLSPALENNQEKLGTADLVLAGKPTPVPPQLRYWIADFNKFAGGLQVSSEKIATYLRDNENARKLNNDEQKILLNILKIINNLKRPPLLTGGVIATAEPTERAEKLQEILAQRTNTKEAETQVERGTKSTVASAGVRLEPTDAEIAGRPTEKSPTLSPLAKEPAVAIPNPPTATPTVQTTNRPTSSTATTVSTAPVAGSATPTVVSAPTSSNAQKLAAPIPKDLPQKKNGFFARRKARKLSKLQMADSPAVMAAGRKITPAVAALPVSATTASVPKGSASTTATTTATTAPATPPATSGVSRNLAVVSPESIKNYPQGGAEYIRQLSAAVQTELQKNPEAKNTLAQNWKQSPLYQKYLEIGRSSMQSGKPIADIIQIKKTPLDLPEFEQVTNLSKILS